MKNLIKSDSKKQINNLVAKIKARYPHLYEETGGRYIRQTLKRMLENEETVPGLTPLFPVFSPNSMRTIKTENKSNKYINTSKSLRKNMKQNAA